MLDSNTGRTVFSGIPSVFQIRHALFQPGLEDDDDDDDTTVGIAVLAAFAVTAAQVMVHMVGVGAMVPSGSKKIILRKFTSLKITIKDKNVVMLDSNTLHGVFQLPLWEIDDHDPIDAVFPDAAVEERVGVVAVFVAPVSVDAIVCIVVYPAATATEIIRVVAAFVAQVVVEVIVLVVADR